MNSRVNSSGIELLLKNPTKFRVISRHINRNHELINMYKNKNKQSYTPVPLNVTCSIEGSYRWICCSKIVQQHRDRTVCESAKKKLAN
jgi:hypothetical protein